jgi:LmbE family N-acetylglucosaminyl deacetylase
VSRGFAAFVAHPDDDAFGITGTVARHAGDPEFRFSLVLATSGEAGMISDPSLATRATLGAVREQEDRDAWNVVGRPPDRHGFLRYPDGGVADVPFDELVERFAGVLRDERPEVVVTFGPDGITGHADHIAVGRAASEAFHRVRAAGGPGFLRLLQLCIPRSTLTRFNDDLVARGAQPMDPTKPFQPRGVDDALVAVLVDTAPVWRTKLAALVEHRTQANDVRQIPEDLREQMLSVEAYVQAWPEREPGAPALRDVFEGLEPDR